MRRRQGGRPDVVRGQAGRSCAATPVPTRDAGRPPDRGARRGHVRRALLRVLVAVRRRSGPRHPGRRSAAACGRSRCSQALAGAGLVAATALLWFDRRRREVALLTVRGLTPAAVALKAVLELAGALLLGSAAGVAPRVRAGRAAGTVADARAAAPSCGPRGWAPSPCCSRRWSSPSVVAVRVPAGHVGSPAHLASHRSLGGRLGLATVVSLTRLGEWGVPVSRGADVSRIDVVGLMFPVLFLTTDGGRRRARPRARPAPAARDQPGLAQLDVPGRSPRRPLPGRRDRDGRRVGGRDRRARLRRHDPTLDGRDAAGEGPHLPRQRRRRPGPAGRSRVPAALAGRSTDGRPLPPRLGGPRLAESR